MRAGVIAAVAALAAMALFGCNDDSPAAPTVEESIKLYLANNSGRQLRVLISVNGHFKDPVDLNTGGSAWWNYAPATAGVPVTAEGQSIDGDPVEFWPQVSCIPKPAIIGANGGAFGEIEFRPDHSIRCDDPAAWGSAILAEFQEAVLR